MLQTLEQMRPARFFVMAALVFELLLLLVTPPLQAPDEFSHFYRAYQVSEGCFLPVKRDQRLGGDMPAGISDFVDQYKQPAYILEYTTTYRELVRSFKIKLQEENRQFRDFANTAYYAPVSYLPQALTVCVLRQFHAPPAVLYYGGRLFTFLTWLWCVYALIKMLPAFQWLFTALALLPMNGYLVNSFSADTVTNLLAFAFIALVLQHIFVTKQIDSRHLLLLALVLGLLVLAKVVYSGLIVLLLAIPASKFKNAAQRWLSLGLLVLLAAGLFVCWTQAVMAYYIPFKDYNPEFRDVACLSPCGDYPAQKQYILQHGFYFLKVIWHTLADHPATYLTGYIGVFGNGDISFPLWVYVLAYAFVLLLAFTGTNRLRFNAWQRLVLLKGVILAYVMLLLSQHLIWDCVGEGVVDLIQGRYLIPILPLLLLSFTGSLTHLRVKSSLLVIPAILALYVGSAALIYHRFFIGQPADKQEIYCDTEATDNAGKFKTSDPAVFFENAGNQVSTEHRSGTHAAMISPTSPFCFTYKFKSLKAGDLVEAEGWQKGQGGLLVFSGRQAGCGEFYFAGTFNSYRDKAGWLRLRNVYQVTFACDSAEIAFYAWNPGKQALYMDDVKLTLTRFKK